MTREEFFYQCMDVIEHWLNGNRKLSDLREVTDKLYNEVTKPHWISVGEEPPMKYEPVLAAFGNHYARVCFYSGEKWYIDAGVMSDEAFGVSHWMQISPPQAPSSSEKPNDSKKGGNQ